MSEKKRRNERIMAMWDSGCRQSEIARAFNITPQRVHQIVGRCKRQEKIAQDPMYSAFTESARRLGKDERSAYRVFHRLTLNGCRTMLHLSKFTDKDFLKIRDIGVGALEIINDAKAHDEKLRREGDELMNEHIVDMAGVITAFNGIDVFPSGIGEEIVRCKDCCCCHTVDDHELCIRFNHATSSYGFCSWGERKGAR